MKKGSSLFYFEGVLAASWDYWIFIPVYGKALQRQDETESLIGTVALDVYGNFANNLKRSWIGL